MKLGRIVVLDIAAGVIGIGVGLWTWLMTYPDPPCGPDQLCIGGYAPRFPAWESALIGAATLSVILALAAAVSIEACRVNLGAWLELRRWLFTDLASATGTAEPGADGV